MTRQWKDHAAYLAKSILVGVLMLGMTSCATTAQAASKKKSKSDSIVMTNRVIDYTGPVRWFMIKKAQADYKRLAQQSDEPIWIKINSPGGSVAAGLVLIDTFKAGKAPIYCLVESRAYSMAAITLLFCDKKYALPHATIMLHEASYGTIGDDMSNRSRMKFTTGYLDRLHRDLAKRLNMSHDAYRKKIRNAWWLLADEAKKSGVVDGVVRNITYKDLAVARTTTMRTVSKRVKSKVLPGGNKKSTIPKRRD
jgi:ATP-dependent Clp protease protease subunit